MNEHPKYKLGCMGSVSDGKSTFVKVVTGITTQKHSSEKERNITINLGYGNMKIYSDSHAYYTSNMNHPEYELVNHISFLDCPGHMELIHTMLTSISIMDGAIVVVAVDQPLTTKPQLLQHLAAIDVGNVKKVIICMNKIDLVEKDTLMKRKLELDLLLKNYNITPYAIIPTSFNKNIGVSHVINCIMEEFNPRDLSLLEKESPELNICRTFDPNKPGTDYNDMIGGILGGTLSKGTLKIGDMIEIRPGILSKDRHGNIISEAIITTVRSIKTDSTNLDEAVPGGLVGIGTDIDPYYCKKNALVGNIIGKVGVLPNVYNTINITIIPFGDIPIILVNDMVTLQIGTKISEGKITCIQGNNYNIILPKPVCINNNINIIVCKMIDKILKIIGKAQFSYTNNIIL